jgi:N-methylhydantoinase A
MAFGGAGPLHANALGSLLGSWPVIIPRGPGVLCASGDATTRMRDEASQTYIRIFADVDNDDFIATLGRLARKARATLDADGIPAAEQEIIYQCDVRYSGQALEITVDFDLEEFNRGGLAMIGERFDALHEQYYTFRLDVNKELVNLRAIVQGQPPIVGADELTSGDGDATRAQYAEQEIYVDARPRTAAIYDRAQLRPGDVLAGPAIVTEMDSTTLLLPAHCGRVDTIGNILIRPGRAGAQHR